MARGPLRRRQNYRNAPSPVYGRKVPNSSPAKLELEKKLAHKPVGKRPVDSDDSDRLVVKGNGRRGRNATTQEFYASGAVASGDKPGAYPSRVQRRQNMTRDTQEILANAQQSAQKDAASGPPTTKRPLREVNGLSGGEHEKAALSKTVPASTIKAPRGLPRSAQPTPSRETSVLGTLKPRRRQPSILQDLGLDSSTLDLEDEDQFLPDDESTPFTLPKTHNASITPATDSPYTSSSRKRKYGSSDPLQPDVNGGGQRQTTSPITTVDSQKPTSHPVLPPMPVSALRESGRKHRKHAGEDDILAPPESSSSLSASPAKMQSPAATRKSRKEPKPLTAITTDALRAQVMPTKRRRTAREHPHTQSEFDIPADLDESPGEPSEPDDESSFLPTKKGRRTKRKEPVVGAASARTKGVARGTKGGSNVKRGIPARATFKSQSSTRRLITTTKPVLTPSTSTSAKRNRKTKSPSQLSSVEVTTSRPNPHEEQDESQHKQYGGSRRRRQDKVEGPDKENLGLDAGLSDDSGVESADAVLSGPKDSEKTPDAVPAVEDVATISKNKWADIDAWDMDFEEVEVMTGSGGSSPMRR
ncbi:hypothetical protein EDD37DRAFT_653340 [Exophiala viscosa]|uniref:Uncharacterized protein n=1 Tax=Exophiala viscosa TaxID=2486360 RepID=A0AAN6DQ40_9EURO|nr:hypothetical protein EDD36DRAFT_468867 [Exophiala viscosa]KAI1621039.1 hypothetical protein EDD37DRAFT_653340 [Exophiala viscosa]